MSELTGYGKQILDSFKKKIIDYFEGITGERNVLYLEKLVNVDVAPAQEREYGIGIPLEKGKKVDFAMTSLQYEMPLVATVRFKDFPLKEVLIRFEFPSVLFGVKGSYPKITFTTTLNMAWPGDFGLIWMPTTTSENIFAFHPYENRENKLEDLTNFYAEGILDPLCDYLNNSQHKLAVKIRRGIKDFIESESVEVWNYQNPFGKKKDVNIIDVPIYCDYFEENDASILYFECYALKKAWIPPADIIVEIMQYIGLATEMFDYDGNLIQDPNKLAEIESQVEALDEHTQKLEKKKRAAELKEEWDPFKPVKQVKRDTLGFAVGETVMKEEHESVLSQVEKMKNLMAQSLSLQEETPVPVEWTPAPQPEPAPEEHTPAPAPVINSPSATPSPSPQPTTSSVTPTIQPTDVQDLWKTAPSSPAPAPSAPEPAPSFQWDDAPQSTPPATSATQIPSQVQPRLRGQSRPTTPLPSTAPPTAQEAAPQPQYWTHLKKQAPETESQVATPSPQSFAHSKDWFAEFQMRQFVTVGNGSDLEFKYRGDFKLISNMPKPFMLTFARDTLRTKKMVTSGEVIDILFRFFQSGHIKVV